MAIDLTGISNDNEFYTHHYLQAILEGDIKDVLRNWARRKKEDEEFDPPYAAIRRLARKYFEIRSRLGGEHDPTKRMRLQREVLADLLPALGYEFRPDILRVDEGSPLPIVGEVAKASGRPLLWVIETIDTLGEGVDPLELSLQRDQLPVDEDEDPITELTLAEVLTKKVFFSAEPPRWIIALSDSQVVLVDRAKWNERRVLRFDLSEILGRRQDSTLRAMAALLHRESTCPDEGIALLDSLDESSHKHAFAVSEDLKYALREAIELLGNEAVYYLREVRKEKIYGRELAGQLTEECLRYMYRLLFLFYIEARPELGYAPVRSEAYRDGYSLESLRSLEMVRLTTDEAREGHFIHDSLSLLFRLIFEGYPPESGGDGQQLDLEGQAFEQEAVQHHTFQISPLQSHLFDPERTPLLNRVRFRNHVLQTVVRLMSLSRPNGRSKRRGRVSYAQLGINQLGAVYEGLLSYRGFFAEEDLYEVKKKGDTYDALKLGERLPSQARLQVRSLLP